MEQIDTASLPQNLEAEQALLGAVLANNKAYEKVSEFLRPYHFADSIHAKIFEVISKLIQRGHVADVITLKNYFEQEGSLNEVGGHQYLIKLADSASPLTNVEYYAQFIYDKYLRRELINTGYEIVNDAMKEDLDTVAPPTIISMLPGREPLAMEPGSSAVSPELTVCLRLLHTRSITASALSSFSSCTPVSSVVFPERRKPPVVASLVTPYPSFIRALISRPESSSCTMAIISFILFLLSRRSTKSSARVFIIYNRCSVCCDLLYRFSFYYTLKTVKGQ